MFLSRVEIDTSNRRKIRDLTHLGAYHSWVEDSFPEEKRTGLRTRKLWRIDHLQGKHYLLIVSQSKPDLNRLERYGVPGSAESKNYDAFLQQIHNGKEYRFRATLNPVHSVSRGEGKRGRVYPEVTAERQMEFLRSRSVRYGFQLVEDEYRITERKYEVMKRKNSPAIRLCKVTYEGRLTITNEEIFRKALTEGIGKKKAYGFGMMTVIPEKRK